jgi:hypothetical protein
MTAPWRLRASPEGLLRGREIVDSRHFGTVRHGIGEDAPFSVEDPGYTVDWGYPSPRINLRARINHANRSDSRVAVRV